MFSIFGMHEKNHKSIFFTFIIIQSLCKKDYILPPNAMMNRDLERKIDLIVDFLKKYGIVDEGIFTFIKTLKVI